jgi:transglutaminase-like putative cysteine protease
MAHLAAGALRSVGIPVRYVSGYLYPSSDGEVGEVRVGRSDAWIEWWAGEWQPYDPTNRVPAGQQHVVLARGRSYDDVPPLRGIFAGPGTQDLDVQVHITRES